METKGNGLISKITKSFGGTVATIVTVCSLAAIFLVTSLVVTFVKKPRDEKARQIRESEAQAAIEQSIAESEALALQNSEEMSSVAGIYVGETGSVIVLYPDGTADYYYETEGVNGGNPWSVNNGTVEMTVNCLLYTPISANIDENSPDALRFTSVSLFWDDETFIKDSDEALSLTAEECAELVNEYYPTAIEETTVVATTTAESSEEAVTSTEETGVSSSLRETMDDYEDFMNSYIAFMNSYMNADPSQMMNMMNDYYDLIEEYEEYVTEIENLDTDNMTAADYAYYIEVTTRVSNNLMNMY